jgi:hypothetical protein
LIGEVPKVMLIPDAGPYAADGNKYPGPFDYLRNLFSVGGIEL